MVARAAGEGPALVAQEAAGALAAFAGDPAGLVTACRRLVDRQPTAGPIWWLAARVLAAGDPTEEAWAAADELEADPTATVLATQLPADVRVCVLGWPEQTSAALLWRGDVSVVVVDALGDGRGLARRLRGSGIDVELVAESGMGIGVGASSLLVLEARALGPSGFVACAGSYAAAAVARHASIPVWVVAGRGRVLPRALWEALVRRLDSARDLPPAAEAGRGRARGPAWARERRRGDASLEVPVREQAEETVPLDLLDLVVGPTGLLTHDEALRDPGCPTVPELLKGLR